VSTPEQRCIGGPEQKYLNCAGKKAPELGAFFMHQAGLDDPLAYRNWDGVSGACSD
jgi:hypothetical protein